MKISMPIRIAGQGIWIPQGKIDLKSLREQGRFSEQDFQEQAYVSLNHDEMKTSRSDVAFSVTQQALQDAGISANQIGFTAFASFSGKDRLGWCQSADLNRRIGNPKTPFMDVYQGCSGVLAAVGVALTKLTMNLEMQSALVAGVDVFPKSEKWNMDHGVCFGDGGGAWILDKSHGPFEILSFHDEYDADVNDMLYSQDEAYNMKPSKGKFIEEHGIQFVLDRFEDCSRKVYSRCLKDAGIRAKDIKSIVIPNFGKDLIEKIIPIYDMQLSQTTWELGKHSGHMACVDPIVNLYQANQQQRFLAGDHIYILVHGAGISVIGMIVKV